MSRLTYDDSGDAFIERVCSSCDGFCGGACYRVACDGCGESSHEDDVRDHGDSQLCEGCYEDELDLERTLDPAGGDEEVSRAAE